MDTCESVRPLALAELAMDPPDPLPYLTTHHLIDAVAESAIDRLVTVADRDSGISLLQLRHMGGALARRSPDAGARATLPGNVSVFALGITPGLESITAVEASLRAVDEIFTPHQVGRYANFVEEPADAREFFDAETWDRLRQVKADYDPDDVFKGNHHIPPAD
jgi:FAD/FMN-containing dehydrogenase